MIILLVPNVLLDRCPDRYIFLEIARWHAESLRMEAASAMGEQRGGGGGRQQGILRSTALAIVCAVALLLLVVGVERESNGSQDGVWLLKEKVAASGVKGSSFAKWFRKQSAATWYA